MIARKKELLTMNKKELKTKLYMHNTAGMLDWLPLDEKQISLHDFVHYPK